MSKFVNERIILKKRSWIAVVLAAVMMTVATATAVAAETEPATTGVATAGKGGIYSGFSGGMMAHVGYGFASNPEDMFRNGSLVNNVKDLPSDGVFFGVGGMARIHLINHIHLGGEGYVSNMPLRKVGQVRTGWGGALIDWYTTWGKVRPFIGAGIGGGAMRRTYVNEDAEGKNTGDENDDTKYNASFTRTPFFYIDPMVGMEFGVVAHTSVIIRIDYLLPFSSTNKGVSDWGEQMSNWKGFMTPSGPRLYLGVMFGH